ncbi:LysR family transcriptional regulator [Jeotgalibacillus sp. R-1-5s-1]|uniref:LysR family transcriptional regulator n=1 Tax=Jeotgalibacillus sp. R-1-5s-1 TaxID=2555897 RepID=UPI00106CE11C|nr:LysR family transcriptional regulator [Jeotgalibacillus sp. R-1-5s-1]TFD94438.1 LysR family transcriptional regulator [Jeotgalibacillus sp. R-1-5s-1]
MELAWLRTFVTAAHYHNFRRTADQLYISQPTVTVHIKLLEKELGATLFDRSAKKVKLTEAGHKYLRHARELLDRYEAGVAELQSFTQGYSSKMSLAISPLIADHLMPYVLKQFLKVHPELEISVKIIESEEIEASVLNGEVDLGLSCLPSHQSDLKSELLFTDQVIMVAPHDGRDAESAYPLEEEELLSSHYLLTHNHPGYWDELAQTVKVFYPSTKMMKVSQTHITKRFIEEGLGVSYLPSSSVRRELLEGRLLEVHTTAFKLPQAHIYAITKDQFTIQKEFITFLSRFRL